MRLPLLLSCFQAFRSLVSEPSWKMRVDGLRDCVHVRAFTQGGCSVR